MTLFEAPEVDAPVAIRALSLWQPWASLVALGHKTIETRSWSTSYRGPLAIHATQRCEVGPLGEFDVEDDTPRRSDKQYLLRGPINWPYRMPLGALVATCLLTDVVPIRGRDERVASWEKHVAPIRSGALWLWHGPGEVENLSTGRLPWRTTDISDQEPYGDYTPGRFAWLLSDIVPIRPPISARGRQQLWTWQPAGAEVTGGDRDG